MADILVIGLPKAIRQPVDLFAKAHELAFDRVYAEVSGGGSHILLPRPEHCILRIREFLDNYGAERADYVGSHILILAYADFPEECRLELEAAEAMGAKIEYADTDSVKPWPRLSRRIKPDSVFHQKLTSRMQEFLLGVGDGDCLLSEYVLRLAKVNANFIIAASALDTCDDIDPTRHDFVRKAVNTIAEAATNGLTSRFDQHCATQGLHHAQSGGSKFTVRIEDGSFLIEKLSCYTHLKSGDATSPQAAARIYYTFYEYKDIRYAALLYAGTHPEGEFKRTIILSSPE